MHPTSCCPRLLTTCALLAVIGCDLPKGDLGNYTATETAGDPGGTATEDGTPATGDSPTEHGTAATTGEPEPDTDPMCGALESNEQFELTLDPPILDGGFDSVCLISDGADSQVLTCGDKKVELRLILDQQPLPLFSAGDSVKFSYRVVMSFGTQEWFSIRGADDSLLLAGAAAEALAPPQELDFFAPLTLSPIEGVCAAPIDCDDMYERLVVDAAIGDENVQVKSGGFAQVGEPAFDVSVLQANKLHNDLPDGQGGFCTVFDAPAYFFQVLMRRVSG